MRGAARRLAAVRVLAALCLVATCGCNWGVDLGKYADFFAMRPDEQLEVFHEYSLEEQVDIYLLNQRLFHHGSFASEVAQNGASVVPILTKRLAGPEPGKRKLESEREKYDILIVFSSMQAGRSYPVSADPELMRLLDESASSIGNELLRSQALQLIEGIRTSEERRNGPFFRKLKGTLGDIKTEMKNHRGNPRKPEGQAP